MDDCLKEVLSHNPWPEMAKIMEEALGTCSECLRGQFVLPQDDQIIREFTNDYAESSSELMLEFPPQPFIGNPSAKIWILQFNPGYSKAIDEFDYLGKDILPESDRHKNTSVFKSARLTDRLKLICRQYRFDEDTGFYALDEKFHTFKQGFRKGQGIYLWYTNVLFANSKSLFHFLSNEHRKKFADRNLFVLEFFPYHSKGFGINFFPFLHSFSFWRALVQYALTHDKIIICHGLTSRKSLTSSALRSLEGYEKAKDDGRIFMVSRPGNGPSRLTLNKDCVLPMSPGRNRLEDFCNQIKQEML